MEKKLILLSHICNIEYMGLVLWLWSFKLNGNAYCKKNSPLCVFIYFEKGKTIFVIVDFFYFVVYFEPPCTYLNRALFFIARLNCWHKPLGAVQDHLNRAIFSIARLNCFHEPHGAVQEYLNRIIFSIKRLNLSI